MKKRYICSDLVKLWSVVAMAIMLMLIISPDWGAIKIVLVFSVGGILMFYAAFLIMILLLGMFGIDVVDKNQYDEWKMQTRRGRIQRVFSYNLYGGILCIAALICGGAFPSYSQSWSGIILEWILYGAMGFIAAQIIMRIIFLMGDITTDKGDIEDLAHEIERRQAEKKQLRKQRKAERRKRNIWIFRAFFRGLGFGAGLSVFKDGGDDGVS